MPEATTPYHHGDLPGALVRAAVDLLEEGGDLSLRAAARRAGVSAAAPYRHFADREALLSAVAAVGYRELAHQLAAAHPAPATADDLAAIAVVYVHFALTRQGLFRAMFTENCDPETPERVAAVTVVKDYVAAMVQRVFPSADPESLGEGVWALVHGMAFLHLDGKFAAAPEQDVARRVRGAVFAVLSAELP